MKKSKDEKRNKIIEHKKRELNYYNVAARGFEESKKLKIAPKDAIISLQNVNKIYPNFVQAVFDFSLDIKPQEFIVYVGPSGCGKSTTLRMIAGLEEITAGDLYIDGKYANDIEPKNRNISMVFQSYALYPNMTVRQNLSFGLEIQNLKKDVIAERVEKAARILEIDEYLDRKPSALSGGQRQRVALGRAIVKASPVFLMDKPLSNLDAKLRIQMRSEIVSIHNRIGATTVYVTHDQTEAMTMATRIVVMDKGRVQQIGTPEEVYSHPNNLFVATFIGSPAMNAVNAIYDNGVIKFEDGYKFSLDKDKNNLVMSFINKQVKEYEELLLETSKKLDKRKLYLSSKAERYKVNSLFKLERKYARKEGLHRTNISNLEKALADGDTDGIQEGIDYLKRKLDVLLTRKDTELKTINSNYQTLLAKEAGTEDKHARQRIEKDDEIEVYNQEITDYMKNIDYYKECKTKKRLPIKFGIRPEDIKPKIAGETFENEAPEIKATIDFVELLGYEYYLYFKFNGMKFISKANVGKHKYVMGEEHTLTFDENKMSLFDFKSGLSLFKINT